MLCGCWKELYQKNRTQLYQVDNSNTTSLYDSFVLRKAVLCGIVLVFLHTFLAFCFFKTNGICSLKSF